MDKAINIESTRNVGYLRLHLRCDICYHFSCGKQPEAQIVPLQKGSSRKVIKRNIQILKGEGKSNKQAVAMALRFAGKRGKKK
jgi:hypothetical protein